MGIYDVRECPCGSGEESEWQFDGRGIPLCRTCEKCHDKQMSKYRPEILDYYTVDEQIEDDY